MQLCGTWLDQLLALAKAQALREAYVATGEPLQCAGGFA
jgi:predicted house-cleaning NTP pyrophosphatase (Maf/HAM1 superfamily)